MFFVLLELMQFIQKIHLSLLVCLNMLHSHSICLLCVLFPHVFSLNLVKHRVLLTYNKITLSFSLKFFDSSPTLWFISVMTIFLLYLRWSLMSLLSSVFLTWFSSCFFLYCIEQNQLLGIFIGVI